MTRTRSRSAGVTIVELLVAISVMTVVLAAVFGTFLRTQRAQQNVTDSVNLRQGARGALQLVERELRMAGSGWGRTEVIGYSGGGDVTLHALTPGPGGVGSSDSVTILGAWGVSTTLDASMPNSSSVLKVVSTTGFSAGDLCVVTDGTSANLIHLTAVEAAAGHLQHNPSSPLNPPGGHNNFPAGGYAAGSLVYKVSQVSYSLDSLSYGRPSVVRRVFGGAPQLLAYDVSSLQFRYRLQDGSTTRAPADLNMIDEILPVITTRSVRPNGRVLQDSVWTSVRPRTF